MKNISQFDKKIIFEISKPKDLTNYDLLIGFLDCDLIQKNKSLFNFIFTKCLQNDTEVIIGNEKHFINFIINMILDNCKLKFDIDYRIIIVLQHYMRFDVLLGVAEKLVVKKHNNKCMDFHKSIKNVELFCKFFIESNNGFNKLSGSLNKIITNLNCIMVLWLVLPRNQNCNYGENYNSNKNIEKTIENIKIAKNNYFDKCEIKLQIIYFMIIGDYENVAKIINFKNYQLFIDFINYINCGPRLFFGVSIHGELEKICTYILKPSVIVHICKYCILNKISVFDYLHKICPPDIIPEYSSSTNNVAKSIICYQELAIKIMNSFTNNTLDDVVSSVNHNEVGFVLDYLIIDIFNNLLIHFSINYNGVKIFCNILDSKYLKNVCKFVKNTIFPIILNIANKLMYYDCTITTKICEKIVNLSDFIFFITNNIEYWDTDLPICNYMQTLYPNSKIKCRYIHFDTQLSDYFINNWYKNPKCFKYILGLIKKLQISEKLEYVKIYDFFIKLMSNYFAKYLTQSGFYNNLQNYYKSNNCNEHFKQSIAKLIFYINFYNR